MSEYGAIIVGGGAAGLFAAANIRSGGRILVIEPNRVLGRKLRITGKGRCNLTNNCSAEEVLKNVLRNPKFLYSAVVKFPPDSIMSWFESRGVPLKTERGRRVFPLSDRAEDVAEELIRECKRNGVTFLKAKVDGLTVRDGAVSGVKCGDKEYFSDVVLLAAGGMSYPRTGSDGSGYALAESVGHTVTDLQPSLVPIEICESFCAALSGLTLKNVSLALYDISKPNKPLYSELGELTFMPFGIGGPLGISASCYMNADKLACKGYKLVIDLKPGLTPEQLDARLQRDIKAAPQSGFDELLSGLLPTAMIKTFSDRLDFDKPASIGNLTREQRLMTASLLKRFELTPKALRGFDEAIVTRGGVSVREISPTTMESKLVKGLYIAGEIIDCDAFTGGYNLTAAFSTAYAAASDISNKLEQKKEVEKWD